VPYLVLSIGDPGFSTRAIAPCLLPPKEEKDIWAEDTAESAEYSLDSRKYAWLFFSLLKGFRHKAPFPFFKIVVHDNFSILKCQILAVRHENA
jgi:hypothetical protein